MTDKFFFSVLLIASVLFTILFVGSYFLYKSDIEKKLIECNGEKIGQENSGQMREIFKCADGTIQII
jgi:hypothetical protein